MLIERIEQSLHEANLKKRRKAYQKNPLRQRSLWTYTERGNTIMAARTVERINTVIIFHMTHEC